MILTVVRVRVVQRQELTSLSLHPSLPLPSPLFLSLSLSLSLSPSPSPSSCPSTPSPSLTPPAPLPLPLSLPLPPLRLSPSLLDAGVEARHGQNADAGAQFLMLPHALREAVTSRNAADIKEQGRVVRRRSWASRNRMMQ